MSKLLDLRDKGIDKVKVVERIIFKPRSFGAEMIRLFSVIVIVLAIGFGISNADDINPFSEKGIETATENFSVLGVVSEISNDSVVVNNAKGSDKSGDTTYTLDISYLEKVETNTNNPLIITDIKIGDTIIAQGLTNNQTFFIKRIVSFGGGIEIVNTDTATTTIDIATSTDSGTTTTDTSTTTEESVNNGGGESSQDTNVPDQTSSSTTTENNTVETSTSTSSSTSTDSGTSTPSIIETVTDVVETVVDTVTNAIENVIDAVTGTSTPSGTESQNNSDDSVPTQSETEVLPEPVI